MNWSDITTLEIVLFAPVIINVLLLAGVVRDIIDEKKRQREIIERGLSKYDKQ